MSLKDTVSLVTPGYSKSVVKAGLRTPSGKGKTWVIVEDFDDVRVYEKFFIKGRTVLLTSVTESGKKGGCRYVEQIVEEITVEEPQAFIMGIRDADYTGFEDNVHVFPDNIFITDCRDLEMMMLSSSSVYSSLVNWNNAFGYSIKKSLHICRLLGYLRICSHINNMNISFKKNIKVSQIWDSGAKTLKTDWFDILLNAFLQLSSPFSGSDLKQFIKRKGLYNVSSYSLCQGHDVLSLIQYIMIKNEYSAVNIMTKMTTGYSLSDFKKTKLYSDIMKWSTSRNLDILEM